jgi:hypothetical protein
VRFEGHDHQDIVYSVPQDWSRYIERVEKLTSLNEDYSGVEAIISMAQLPWFGVEPTRLASWIDQGYEPQDLILRDMVHDLRQFVSKKAKINDQAYTGTHLLTEFMVKVFPITVRYNWTPYLKSERKEWRDSFPDKEPQECTEDEVPCTNEFALPSGLPAAVTFVVPITQMKQWGLDNTMQDIKRVLQHALNNAPTKEEAPAMADSVPPERAFLLHCQEKALEQDLRRYTLFEKERLSFRQIAFLEQQQLKGKRLIAQDVPPSIKHKIPGESGVWESIKRIFEGIYLRPFKGIRHTRTTAVPLEMPAYQCDVHGQDCPLSCPTITQWMKKYESSLPSVTQGSRIPDDFGPNDLYPVDIDLSDTEADE